MATIFYTAIFGVILILLSINVIFGRRKYKIAYNHGGNHDLKRRIRAHANFVEYTPFFIIMLACAEHSGLNWYYLNLLGALFLLGRFLHAYGLLKAEYFHNDKIYGVKFRIYGMLITFLCITVLSIALLWFCL